MRILAQRSAEAAKEIKGLIWDSEQKVQSGIALVDRSGEALREIVTSVKRVGELVEEVATAWREQAARVEHVNQAVTEVDRVTQTNATQTEELSSTAQALTMQNSGC